MSLREERPVCLCERRIDTDEQTKTYGLVPLIVSRVLAGMGLVRMRAHRSSSISSDSRPLLIIRQCDLTLMCRLVKVNVILQNRILFQLIIVRELMFRGQWRLVV